MSLDFTLVDVLALLIVLASMGYAIYRGFVAETLSVFAWAAAAFAALYFGPWVTPHMLSLVSTWWIATLLAYAAVFLVVFIPLSFASHRFASGVKSSAVGPLDRVLGATFGIVRGLAVIGFLYIIFSMIVPVRDQPRQLTDARTLPLMQSSAEVLLAVIPHNDSVEAAAPPRNALTADLDRLKTKPEKRHPKSYGARERQALDRLFEATGNGESVKP
jgi:membrane protein required for colicin V production